MAMDDAIAQAEALRAQLEAELKGKAPPATPAPAPGATVPPEGQMSPVEHAEIIRQRGQEGRLPSQAQLRGEPEPPAQDTQSRLGRVFGLDNAVSNILRYVGPYIGMPEVYNPVDSALHGYSLGTSDVARGYQRDIITGQPWGTGAGEVKAARDEFATEHPAENLAGNVVGGVAMPLPGIGYATKAIEQIPGALGKIGASLGLGAGLGGATGAIGGAIDEAPAGAAAAAEGAKHGGTMGALFGTALPLVVGAGAGAGRWARDFFGPQVKGGRAAQAAAGREIVNMETDPAKMAEVGELPPVQGPPMLPGGTITSDDPAWAIGPRNLTPRQQQQAALKADEARVDPNAGVLLPGQEPGMPARPTISQIADDPGIRDLESKLVADITRTKPDKTTWTQAEADLVGKVDAQSKARTAAIRAEVDPSADPTAVQVPLQEAQRGLAATQEAQTAAAQQRAADLVTSQEAATAAAQQRLQAEQQRLGRDLTAEERGAIIRTEQAAGKADSKKGGIELNTQLAAADAVTDQSATAAAATKIQKGMLENDKAQTGEELEIFDRALMQGKAMPLAETLVLRSRITDEVRTVQQDPKADQRSVPRLVQLRQAIDATLEPHVAGLDDATGSLYRERQDYWKQHAETYKNDTTGEILQAGANKGGYQMVPEAVATRILRDNSSAAAHLKAGGTQESLRGALVDDLYRFAKGRPLTDQILTTWRSNRQGALRAAPGLDAEIGNVGQAQRAIDDLARTQKVETATQASDAATLAKTQKAEREAFEDGAIGKVVNAHPADVGPTITRMLVSDKSAGDMMILNSKIAGDPAAKAALKRIAMDHIDKTYINPQSGQLNPAAFRKFLNDKAPALETALGAEGMQVLRLIERDLARPMPGGPTMVGANKGGTPSSSASLFRSVLEGKRGRDFTDFISPPAILATAVADPSGATTTAGIVAKTMQILRNRGINNTRDMLVEAVQNPAMFRAMRMQATRDNMSFAEKALEASLATAPAAGRQGATVGYDYGEAEKRQRQNVRRRLLEPVP